jgi:uncharacterized protein (TIGR00645 family)
LTNESTVGKVSQTDQTEMIDMPSLKTILPQFIFSSRWLQAPLYFGLIVVMGVYVYEFGAKLFYLVGHAKQLSSNNVMLEALDLIDVVMIANLLVMVIVGGYETFVSKLHLSGHKDHPEWLDEVNAGTMKIKLSIALVSISSIHLLRTFIDPTQRVFNDIMWQVVIHVTLLISTLTLAFSNKLISSNHNTVQNVPKNE